MDNRHFLIALILLWAPVQAIAQQGDYKFEFAPDLWYNSVDGVRVGARVLGEVEGTFKDGPHRLDAGIWLGTRFPDLPVSYFISFTEPIPSFSSYANEANISTRSSIRTGYSHHQLSFNKRFQSGFDELKFREVSIAVSQEKLIDAAYRPYPALWQNEWKTLASANFWVSSVFEIGKFDFIADVEHNFATASGIFTVGTVELKQQIKLGSAFQLRLRGFSGLTNNDAAPEYLFSESFRQPVKWLNNGVSRAKGTLPQNWLDDGIFQVAGGANLRGYTQQNFEKLAIGEYHPYNFVASVNMEFEFPNPFQSMLNASILGDFVKLRSYAFADAGSFYRKEAALTPNLISSLQDQKADAGLGIQFSINIPDYLGKDRGFALRYEVPFWLSLPKNAGENFKFRNLIGIGAVISL